MAKIPELRVGLSIDDLLADSELQKLIKVKEWPHASRYPEMETIGFEVVEFLLNRLIQHVNGGGRVTRQALIEGFTTAGKMSLRAKGLILQKMNDGDVTPSVLDKLASI